MVMNKKLIIRQMAGILSLIAAALLPYGGSALALDTRSLVEVELLTDKDRLVAGGKFRLGLLFKISPGCHIYWMNPGDAGLAPQIEWNLPEGFHAGPVFWPAPKRMEEPGGLLVNVYTEEVMHFPRGRAGERIKDSSVSLQADASWVVCRKICVQESAEARLDLPVGSAPAKASLSEDIFSRYAPRVPRPASDFPTLRSETRWIRKTRPQQETRTGIIVLESMAGESIWLTGEDEFYWFGHPYENLTSGEIHYDAVHSSAKRLVLHLSVRKLDPASAWPAKWGGVLTTRLVKAGADTVNYALSLDFTEQAE